MFLFTPEPLRDLPREDQRALFKELRAASTGLKLGDFLLRPVLIGLVLFTTLTLLDDRLPTWALVLVVVIEVTLLDEILNRVLFLPAMRKKWTRRKTEDPTRRPAL